MCADGDPGAEVETSPETVTTAAAVADNPISYNPISYDAVVVNTYPHDDNAFTQGLEFVNGQLLESTGLVGSSTIRLVDPASGAVTDQQPLTGELFGEGATVIGEEVWQLTYTSETAVVYQLDGLIEDRRFAYEGEGWGLCYNGASLVMSNGSDQLTLRSPDTFAVTDVVDVTRDGEPVAKLNELECVDGVVWANIWQTNEIVAIDGATGAIIGSADLTALVPDGFEDSNNDVLNGIAYHHETGRFWVTGKHWPVMYEIELTPGT